MDLVPRTLLDTVRLRKTTFEREETKTLGEPIEVSRENFRSLDK